MEAEETCTILPVISVIDPDTIVHIEDNEIKENNVELVKIADDELIKYSEGIITFEDGSQWYKIPLPQDQVDEIYTEEYKEEPMEHVETEIEEPVAQVTILEDGTIAFVQPTFVETEDEKMEKMDPKPAKKRGKNHSCSEPGCKRSYTSLHHLKVHVRNHTGDRPYKCTIEGCDKAFATDYSRKAHVRTHTGEKPYPCPFMNCTKCFKTSGDLQKHIRTHTGERPFECPVAGCNKSFTTSNIRKIHLRTHTGERPYVCDFDGCQRSFASSTNYKNHMRIHSGEKPYCCAVENCDKRFTEYSSLYKHNLVHSQVKNFQCVYCFKTYRQLSTLNTHKRTIHGVIAAEDGTEIMLEQMIGIGKDGTKNFKNITSTLLHLKREKTNANDDLSDENDDTMFIISQDPIDEGVDPMKENSETLMVDDDLGLT